MEENKTALITGGTDGIGKATAVGIAHTGANVIVVGRNRSKALAAVDEIKRESSNMKITAMIADLSTVDEIDRLVSSVRSDRGTLDILVNNIGFMERTRQTTADGFEKIIFMNYLLHFYLTHRLLPLLQLANGSRIVNVTGGAHAFGKINFDDLQAKKDFKPYRVFAQAKLALVQFSLILSKRLTNGKVSVFVSDPGTARSGMGPANKAWPWMFRSVLMPLMATSPEIAARSSIYAATSEKLKNITGVLIDRKCRIVKPAKAATDEDVASKLWMETEKMLGIQLEKIEH